MSEPEEHALAGTLHQMNQNLGRMATMLEALDQRMTRTESAVAGHAKELAARSGLSWSHVSVMASIIIAAVLAGTAYMHQSIDASHWRTQYSSLKELNESENQIRNEMRRREELLSALQSSSIVTQSEM
ncbi:hypothetical protein EBZ80_10485 [bacterium]|nr:hypothetical protein [bacterium]